MEQIAYIFSDAANIPKLETLADEFPYWLKLNLLHGFEPSRESKNRLYRELQSNSYSKTGIPLHGWMFDFRKWLKCYYVEFTHGHIQKVYAFDKTSIRANEKHVHKIVEVN